MGFEEIFRSRPRRRVAPHRAEGLWSLKKYSALARAGGRRLTEPRALARRHVAYSGFISQSPLVVRKLSFLVFFILGMDFGGVAIELGSSGLDGELPVDLDRLGAALVEQGQHLPAQGLDR